MKVKITATEAIALWGAIAGTTTLIWNIIKWRRDRGRLKVSLGWSFMVPDDGEFIFLTAINVGRCPVVIKHWMLKQKSGKWEQAIIKPDDEFGSSKLPIRLDEGKQIDDIIPDNPELHEQFRTIRCFAARDSTGKLWKMSRRALRQFQRSTTPD